MPITLTRRQFGGLTGIVAAAAGLSACSGSGSGGGKGKVVWSTWGSPEDLKSFDRFQEAFKTNNPEIELVFQPTPSYSEYHSKLLTQLSSGTAPDVFYIGDDRVAAPRLAQVRAKPAELRELFHQIVDFMHLLAAAGLAHGDLSPYNLLVHHGRVVVIDLPQVIDVIANPAGLELLHRDCVNVCDWFTRQRLECDAEELFGELVGALHW